MAKSRSATFKKWYKANKLQLIIYVLLAMVIIATVYSTLLYEELYFYKAK